MRGTLDRIRHTVGFEVFGLAIFAPLGSWVFGYELHQMGIIGAVASLIAAIWNYIYNLMFDRAMVRFTGQVRKSPRIRVLHALLFELGLLIVFLPSVAWYLKISLLDALIMDLAVAAFYVVYAFVYNWLYDIVFPIPEREAVECPQSSAQSS
ncbi:PACE efflux transporter [Cupriavidus sp. AU9028]|uniref:PACE efflux transporter n=1 Tax=Cupriavidus sp. AU9028 TaxID=2871157 RepID=UPI001C94431D|nr:PACE efflux transporter [Cupriavidus sp. AU9028]MBY4895467.1 PACE efflux transporter [Cupriavidus sp. AU9028]